MTALRDVDDVRAWLAEHVYAPRQGDPAIGKVGLEVELFPFWVTRDGRPAARLALVELVGLIDEVPGAVRNPDHGGGRPSWTLDGALLTEEPGAQLEVAGPPEPDTATAIANVEAVVAKLAEALAPQHVGLAAAGLDCWSDRAQLPVQLSIQRYQAMTTYWQRRGDRAQGHMLMCATCSLQINVDMGPPEVAARRWVLANLAAPVLTAAFAASPTPQAVNGRAVGWRRLDPSRTGVAPPLVAGADDPLEHVLADALRADVMLVERDGTAHPGKPDWSFGRWVAEGHPRFGRPTSADLATHLTTLFPESRLRGFLEVRGVDELPTRWRGAAVALVCGLLYDERAAGIARDLLEPHRTAVPELLDRAADDGLRDPLLGKLSPAVLEAGLDGARRLDIPQAAEAADYLETFTVRGRHPSDELRDALAVGPAAALAWALERPASA